MTTPSTKVYVYEDAKGEWRWRAEAGNNRIVAESGEGYDRRSAAINAAEAWAPQPHILHAADSVSGRE